MEKTLENLQSNIKTLIGLKARESRVDRSHVYLNLANKNISDLENSLNKVKLADTKDNNYYNEMLLDLIQDLKKNLASEKFDKIFENINEFSQYSKRLKIAEETISFDLPNMPAEIKETLASDLEEIKICFGAGAYRSCLILCARIIETSLHRKYYEVTKKDLLVSEPNIGLGKLIKRLNEHNIIYPGLREQIDMLNQLRVHNVHKKRIEITANKAQAHGAILYTIDILNKLFSTK